MWKRWFARRVNAIGFWAVLVFVGAALALAASFVVPGPQHSPEIQLPSDMLEPR